MKIKEIKEQAKIGLKGNFFKAIIITVFYTIINILVQMLIKNLSGHLKENGRFSIAHSMSRAEIQSRHKKRASNVSLELPTAEVLAEMLRPYFNIDIIISDNEMYQVSGIKK